MDELDTHTDEATERLAAELYDRVRQLNHATQGRAGLTRPEAAYSVLGNLAQASFSLAQTAEQFDAFLDRELAAGRLGHDRDADPVPVIVLAHNALARANEQAADLGESFRRAQSALTAIHSTVDNGAEIMEKAEATVAEGDERMPPDIGPARKDFPTPIGEALSGQAKPEPPPPAQRPSAPHPPRPRREP